MSLDESKATPNYARFRGNKSTQPRRSDPMPKNMKKPFRRDRRIDSIIGTGISPSNLYDYNYAASNHRYKRKREAGTNSVMEILSPRNE